MKMTTHPLSSVLLINDIGIEHKIKMRYGYWTSTQKLLLFYGILHFTL